MLCLLQWGCGGTSVEDGKPPRQDLELVQAQVEAIQAKADVAFWRWATVGASIAALGLGLLIGIACGPEPDQGYQEQA